MLDTMTRRIAGFRGEFLWEFEIATRQTVAMAEAIPEEKYGWRPDRSARSASEVLVHIATGNFMLLDAIGITAPTDIYAHLPGDGSERSAALMRANDELAANLREKSAVVSLLKRSFETLNQSFNQASEAALERRLHFFGEETTVRRVYLRLLAHSHEHMGQMIAYLRCNGIAPPWPDWRPDRRTAS